MPTFTSPVSTLSSDSRPWSSFDLFPHFLVSILAWDSTHLHPTPSTMAEVSVFPALIWPSSPSAIASLSSGTPATTTTVPSLTLIVLPLTAADLTTAVSTARAYSGLREGRRSIPLWSSRCSCSRWLRWCCRARWRRCSGRAAREGGLWGRDWGSGAHWSSCRLWFHGEMDLIRCDQNRGLGLGHRGSL